MESSRSEDEIDAADFQALAPEESVAVLKIYNILSGGITDPQIQALLVFRHLTHTGWIPPNEAESLKKFNEDAKADLKLLRKELGE